MSSKPSNSGRRERQPGTAEAGDQLPVLIFFWHRRSGPARRMAGLVAWVRVNQKRRLRVVDVDVDRNPGLVERLRVTTIPSLVLIKGRRVVGRLEGRATGREIERLIAPFIS